MTPQSMVNLNLWDRYFRLIWTLVASWVILAKKAPFPPLLYSSIGLYLAGMVLFAMLGHSRRWVVLSKDHIRLEGKIDKVILDFQEQHQFIIYPHPKGKSEQDQASANRNGYVEPRVYRDSYYLALLHMEGWVDIAELYGEIEAQQIIAKISGLDNGIKRGDFKFQEEEPEHHHFWNDAPDGKFWV